MTSRYNCTIAWFLIFLFDLIVPSIVLTMRYPVGFAIVPAILASVAFMLWSGIVSCPRGGTPFLWEIRGHTKIVRPLPLRACKECGLSTDTPYRENKAVQAPPES